MVLLVVLLAGSLRKDDASTGRKTLGAVDLMSKDSALALLADTFCPLTTFRRRARPARGRENPRRKSQF